MDFTQVVDAFLAANPRISRDERNLALIVEYINKCGIAPTPENAHILLEGFIRENHDKILWLENKKSKPESDPVRDWYSQGKAYNLQAELEDSKAKRRQERERFANTMDKAARRSDFETALRKISSHREHRGYRLDWATTFTVQRGKYEALKKQFPEWTAEITAAQSRVGK